jgi:hypothetical protein
MRGMNRAEVLTIGFRQEVMTFGVILKEEYLNEFGDRWPERE